MSRGLLLVGHGSRDQAGNAQFLALARSLAAALPWPLEPCFLDHAEPDIPAGFRRLVQREVGHIAVLPLFLFAAGHAKRDVPKHLTVLRERYPEVRVTYGRPLGVEERLVAACAALLADAEGDHARPGARARTAVLLVGRGSSDPEATAGLYALADMLKAATGYGAVACAFCDVASPRVPEGLEQLVQMGFRQVILLPYFLFRGVLMGRLKALLQAWQEREPSVSFRFAGPDGLGPSPYLPPLLWKRAEEAFESWSP